MTLSGSPHAARPRSVGCAAAAGARTVAAGDRAAAGPVGRDPALHTGGRHIDLEVYRLGVQAWLAGGDLYGPLPPDGQRHIALPFIYPPFAALLMRPLRAGAAGPRPG